MAKIIKIDNSIGNYLKRADEMLNSEDIIGAIGYVNRALTIDKNDIEANLLLADIYNMLTLFDFANQVYFNILSRGKNVETLQCLISNLMQAGDFARAKYYNDKYGVDFDFSTLISGISDYDDADDLEDGESALKLVVSRKKPGDKNRVEEDDEVSLWERLEEITRVRQRSLLAKAAKEKGFKQVYPRPKKECEALLERGVELLMQGRHSDALELFGQIEKSNKKQYCEAQKCKAMCYLALVRYTNMLTAVEEAAKGKPDDYSLKCYRYIALKLLEEPLAAKDALEEVLAEKPTVTMDIMNKLDVCRLAENHEGVLENASRVLEQLPYQPVFLILYGKAQYNTGDRKGAVFTLKTAKKLFPDMWEPPILLERIEKYNVDGLSYSDVEVTIKRVKLLSEINIALVEQKSFSDYLKNYDGAKRKLHFVLSGDTDAAYGRLITTLSAEYSDELREVYDLLLLDARVPTINKNAAISTIILHNDLRPIKALFGNFYKEVTPKPLNECDKLPSIISAAYSLCFAEYLSNENRFEALCAALTNYTNKLIDVINRLQPDDFVYAELAGLRSVEILKTVLYERVKTLSDRQKKSYLKEVGGSTYTKYKNILKSLEEYDGNN